jgi:murein L,D-transpeptidase YafK
LAVPLRLLALALAILGIAALAWANAPAPAVPPHAQVDRLLVLKKEHRLRLLQGGHTVAEFTISLGRGAQGPKEREGDGRTPEGVYVIDHHNPNSAFFRSLHISYPGSADLARARALGVSPGGAIMIHGLPPKLAWVGRLHRAWDWTNGCIALSNPEMKQVFDAVHDGTPIEIRRD